MVYSVIAGFSVVYIRGVGTDAFLPSADASISTYIDGIFFPFTHGLVQSFGAVERVEVLKGPQGTLFGRNSTGGAISVITKAPTDEFEGTFEMRYATSTISRRARTSTCR
jgi:iron complex outermembrane recepter protein